MNIIIHKNFIFMKTTFLNIVKTLFACVCAVVLNCVLIWMGVLGFATSTVLVVFAIAGYLGLDNTSASVEWRSLLCGLVALLYFYTIWQPEFWITVLSGAAIVAVLLKKKDYAPTTIRNFFIFSLPKSFDHFKHPFILYR